MMKTRQTHQATTMARDENKMDRWNRGAIEVVDSESFIKDIDEIS